MTEPEYIITGTQLDNLFPDYNQELILTGHDKAIKKIIDIVRSRLLSETIQQRNKTVIAELERQYKFYTRDDNWVSGRKDALRLAINLLKGDEP